MNTKKTELKIVEVHGQKLTTTSLVIADNCNVKHKATIQLIKNHLDDLMEDGRVAFEMRSFGTKGGTQEQEIAVLDDYSARLLLTHMRSNKIVSKFKKELVKEFKRIRKLLNEPNRKQEIQLNAKRHYSNEAFFCNRALTNVWGSLDEATLDIYDARQLSAIRNYNTLLMTRHLKQSEINPIKWIMQALAQFDFERGTAPRLKNKYYIERYGECYAIAESQDYYTGDYHE
jgi:phage regulator Rha-like protein